MPTRLAINRSGYKTPPGQPDWRMRTDLPAPSTGPRGAATSIDTGASRQCRCACPCQPAGRQIDPATKQRPVNRADNRVATRQPVSAGTVLWPGNFTLAPDAHAGVPRRSHTCAPTSQPRRRDATAQPRRLTPAPGASADTRAHASPPGDKSTRLQNNARSTGLTAVSPRASPFQRAPFGSRGTSHLHLRCKCRCSPAFSHVRTDLTAPSTGRHGAATSMDTSA